MTSSIVMKKGAVFGFVLMFVLSLCVAGWWWYAELPILPAGQQSVVLHYKKGMSASQLVELLAQTTQLRCPDCARFLVRVYPKVSSFQSGYYRIDNTLSWRQWFKHLARGEVLALPFTIIEGQTSQQVMGALREAPWLESDASIERQFLANCQLCANHSIEGMFLANTFVYQAGEHSGTILDRAHRALLSVLAELWADQRVRSLPYQSPRELLVAASIIEKETASPEEKPLIASVIVNRIRRGMRLQMDPTVIYGLGERYRYPLTRENLRQESPFNTYLHKGLPPHPIANVSEQTLHAAAYPTEAEYLYFYSEDGRHHQFSRTLEEHSKWIQSSKQHR